MKVNIQKGFKCAIPLLVVAVMVFTLLPSPAYAAERSAYKASDYITDVAVDGNTKTVTFNFSEIAPLTNVWPQGAGSKVQFIRGFEYLCPPNSYGLASRTYYGGVEVFEHNPCPLTGAIDVSDIMPGAPITLTMSYNLIFALDADHPKVTVTIGHGYFAYDKAGNYKGQYYGEGQSKTYQYGGSDDWGYSVDTDFVLGNDIFYIIPFTSLSITYNQLGADDYLSFSLGGFSLSMTTDINMVYTDSVTGQQISDKLDEIIDGPSDVTGDVDEILGGTANQKDKVNNLIGEMGQMQKPNVNTIKPNLSAVVNPASSQMLAASVGNIVENPFVLSLLTITATILLVSFVLFGKKR